MKIVAIIAMALMLAGPAAAQLPPPGPQYALPPPPPPPLGWAPRKIAASPDLCESDA
jgi:hypothetical protein